MANQIKRVEDAIVARLRAFYAPDALAVEPFPEDREKYRLAHPKGAALVAFAGERFGPDSGVGMVRQERTMRFAVAVLILHRRSHGGAYEVLEGVRAALTGYRVPDLPGDARLRPVQTSFEDESGGRWEFTRLFEVTTPALGPATEEAALAQFGEAVVHEGEETSTMPGEDAQEAGP